MFLCVHTPSKCTQRECEVVVLLALTQWLFCRQTVWVLLNLCCAHPFLADLRKFAKASPLLFSHLCKSAKFRNFGSRRILNCKEKRTQFPNLSLPKCTALPNCADMLSIPLACFQPRKIPLILSGRHYIHADKDYSSSVNSSQSKITLSQTKRNSSRSPDVCLSYTPIV